MRELILNRFKKLNTCHPGHTLITKNNMDVLVRDNLPSFFSRLGCKNVKDSSKASPKRCKVMCFVIYIKNVDLLARLQHDNVLKKG